MSKLARWSGVAAVVLLAASANRVEAQLMFGYGGSVRYGYGYPYGGVGVRSFRGPLGGGVTSYRGPLGGGVTVAQGPFGGGAVSVRGPFGGGINIVNPALAPVVPVPVAPVVPYVVAPRPVVQTVLNPAVLPTFSYTPAYLARIPAGYPTLEIAAVPYYYTSVLPVGCQSVVVGGVNLFVGNGVFYQPYSFGGRTVYVIVER